MAERNKGKFETQLEALKEENNQLRDKINVLDKVASDKTKLEKALNNLEEKNRSLMDQVKSVPGKEKLLERSKELKQKIVSLNEQLTTQKMLIEGYE